MPQPLDDDLVFVADLLFRLAHAAHRVSEGRQSANGLIPALIGCEEKLRARGFKWDAENGDPTVTREGAPEPLQATPANMRRFQAAGWAFIGPNRLIAYSPLTGAEESANPGDYWDRVEDAPLLDSEGEPMILVTRKITFIPAF